MPEQASRAGTPVTPSEFTAPFQTPVYPLGSGGIDLASAIDKVEVGRFTRLTNAYFSPGDSRELTGRPGQTAFVSLSGEVQAIGRLSDATDHTTTYLWGAGTTLALGASGSPTTVATGFSGDPLTILPARPPLSGAPWAYVGDSAKMVKVRDDGLVLPIGLPPLGSACQTSLAGEQKVSIADATTSDAWTANGGFDFSQPPLDVPAGLTETGGGGSTFTTAPGTPVLAAGNGYWNFWGLPRTLNLGTVGLYPASDDDLIHLALKFGNPALVAELRLYFVVSEVFSESVLPGLSVDSAGTPTDANQDYYVKSFRVDDFTPVVQAEQAQVIAAETARVNQLRQDAITALAKTKGFISPSLYDKELQAINKAFATPPVRVNPAFLASQDPSRDISVQGGGSANQYTEFGSVGIPLRRGEWKRYGSTAGRDWSTVTGLIVYLQATQNAPDGGGSIFATILNWWLTGGSGPDTSDPAAQSYDYRATNYDPRTGVESNPSPVMDVTVYLDALRRAINITPVGFPPADAALRQRFYRRGGALTDDWYYVGVNTSNLGNFVDRASDLEIAEAGTVELDHYQPVTTVDASGGTVLAQAIPILFGPYNGQLLGLGDPYRPGFVYASLPNQPDIWPQDLLVEVCPTSEELMNGVMYGGQPFVLSRQAGYAIYGNLSGATSGLSSGPSGCKHGLAGRWAVAVGAGRIWFLSTDNGFFTTGGAETPFLNDLWPLFHGETANGYLPIDFSVEAALRLEVFDNEVWVGYQDTHGDRQVWVYNVLSQQTRHYDFAVEVSAIFADQGRLLLGGVGGNAYTHDGTSDAGAAIPVTIRTAAWDAGLPRQEKLYGDQILDVDPQGVDLTWQNFLNEETVTNPSQALGGFSGRRRVILDSFGTEPQLARTVSTEIGWSTAAAPPILYFLGTSISPQPDLTINRVTTWDDLGHPDPKYVMGVTFDCNTGGSPRTILIEADFNGIVTTVANLTVNADGRHKLAFTWTGIQAHQIRVRPDDTCAPWLLYRADWNFQPEPPKIGGWDLYFENQWDHYYTGLDLYCDTGGATKQVAVQVDGNILTNPETGLGYWPVVANGRQVVHLTFTPGRGHVFRAYALDVNPGQVYSHRWQMVEEPSEQKNFNSPFTILGTQADKYVKAVILEMDSFGLDKTIAVEADGVVVDTITANTSGRLVRQIALPGGMKLGRVWRFLPTDFHPARLYTIRLVFDEEPFQLDQWQSQPIDHGFQGFHYLIDGMISLKSTTAVTLRISTYVNQTGTIVTDDYVIPSTAGVKLKQFVPFNARKGVLYQYHFLQAAAPYFNYLEESFVTVADWQGGEPVIRHPFGNTGADIPTRSMIHSELAAERSGGGA